MRAIRVSAFGGPEVLKYVTDAKVPEVGCGQVLVRAHAVGVNPVDTYIRAGISAPRPSLPYTPGGDASGVVDQVGEGVKSFKAGDKVYVCGWSGSYAEFSLWDESKVHPLPDSLSFNEGAALGVPYFTACRALFHRLKAKPSESVLIHGASGGVGLAAVQLSKAKNMVVLGTAGTEEGMALVKKAGADHTFNHRSPNYIQEIMEVTEGKGVDVILEMLANVNLDKDLDLVAANGRIGVIGNKGRIEIDPRKTMGKESSVMGITFRKSSEDDIKEYACAVQEGADEGWLKPFIGSQYKLQDACSAHTDIIDCPGAKGKVILTID